MRSRTFDSMYIETVFTEMFYEMCLNHNLEIKTSRVFWKVLLTNKSKKKVIFCMFM